MYDTIIIGGGPAALAASIYAARQKINFVVIAKEIGGQIILSADFENYLGFWGITGLELVSKFEEHIKRNNVNVIQEEVVSISKKKDSFLVKTGSKEHEAKSVLIATGRSPRKLNVKGESEFLGKGVVYCATCDAPLFASKQVVIVGGGNSALDSAILLDKYCTKITIVNITPTLTGERHMIEQVQKNPKIDFLNGSRIVEILGDKFVNAVRVDVNGSQKIIKTQGVFIEIGSVPCVSFDNLTKKNKYNEIIVSEDEIYSNKTSVEGIFAAGDVTSIPEKQAIVSAGEGAKAILSIFKYLGTKK